MAAALYSPFPHLPNELISKIFRVGSLTDSSFPMLVASVCGHWRSIVINAPDVWTNITIYMKNPGAQLFTDMWLKRSKLCSLDIRIVYTTLPLLENNEKVARILVDRAQCWRSLTLDGYVTALDLRAFSQAPLKYLKSVSVNAHFGVAELPGWGTTPHATHTVSIDSLQLVRSSCPWKGIQLRFLHLCQISVDQLDLYELFGSSPSLEDVTLEDVHVAGDTSISLTVVELVHLTNLSLKYTATPAPPAPSPFISVAFPNLGHLQLSGSHFPDTLTPYFGGRNAQWKSLQTLRLSHLRPVRQLMDTEFTRSLQGVRSLEFVQTPIELLFPSSQTRQRTTSIGKRALMFRARANPDIHVDLTEDVWPQLNTILLDSFTPDDMARLCSIAKSRPHLILRLSGHARRQIPEQIDGVEGIVWLQNHCERMEAL